MLIATVAENREPFLRSVLDLFRSLRTLGGTLECAKATTYFIGSASPDAVRTLAELHVSVRIVDPLDVRCPHANKIIMLNYDEDYRYLVALDNDIAVVRDFSRYIEGTALRARPAGHSPLTIEQWESVFTELEFAMPPERLAMCTDLSKTIPYFNSGVLIVPRAIVGQVRNTWERSLRRLLDRLPCLGEIAQHAYYSDQLALAIAVASGQIPCSPLPVEMNRMVHYDVHPSLLGAEPYLLHHHYRYLRDGWLAPSPFADVNPWVDVVNRAVNDAASGHLI